MMKYKKFFWRSVLFALLLLITPQLVSAQGNYQVKLISAASDGTQANNDSYDVAIASNGLTIAFASTATNLSPVDADNTADVFVREHLTGVTTCVSVSSAGIKGNGGSWFPALSADGQIVAFESEASNLVSGDTNARGDVFVHNRQTGITVRVSVSSLGAQGDESSSRPSISADGRYVVFESSSAHLVSGDTNGRKDIFLHDLQIGTTTLISSAHDDTPANADSNAAVISADGQYIAFTSYASNIIPSDNNNAPDVFLYSREAGTTIRVSVATNGSEGNAVSESPALSSDGQIIAFESQATNLVSGDTNGYKDIFVRDLQEGTTERVSTATDGTQANNPINLPRISGDGRLVIFTTSATNLTPGDTFWVDVFLHDRQSGTTSLISTAEDGTQGNMDSSPAVISTSGAYIAYLSYASNLIANDVNGHTLDVFLFDQAQYAFVPLISK